MQRLARQIYDFFFFDRNPFSSFIYHFPPSSMYLLCKLCLYLKKKALFIKGIVYMRKGQMERIEYL